MSRGRPLVLCFAHADIRHFAGGLAKYIHEEEKTAADRGMELVTVFPLHLRQFPRLRTWASRGWGVCREGRWRGIRTWKGLVHLLGKWEGEGSCLAEIQLHHIGGYHRGDLRAFLEAVRAPVRLFLHDYHTVCRSLQLLRDGRTYCGMAAPCETKCHGCSNWNPDWLPQMKRTLGKVGQRLRVTSPSESAAAVWLESWPEFRGRIEVVPHWTVTRQIRGTGRKPDRRLKVAFAGAQIPHKGWDSWCRTVEALQKSGTNYCEFLYFGLGKGLPAGVRAVIVGEGGMTGALRREGVDFLCLWSIWPETYSYVYYEAVQAGVWVLAPEVSGNIAAAIRKGGWGTLFRNEGELQQFLGNEMRARAVLEQAKNVARPAEMAVNPKVVDELPTPQPLGLRDGWTGRSWMREALWALKEWTGHV